jgi:hypothetical protein
MAGLPSARPWEPWPNTRGYLVLPDDVLATIYAALPYDRLCAQAHLARDVYRCGEWTREDAEAVRDVLAAAVRYGHPTINQPAAYRSLVLLSTAIEAARWPQDRPIHVLVWDGTRDRPVPHVEPPDFTSMQRRPASTQHPGATPVTH